MAAVKKHIQMEHEVKAKDVKMLMVYLPIFLVLVRLHVCGCVLCSPVHHAKDHLWRQISVGGGGRGFLVHRDRKSVV